MISDTIKCFSEVRFEAQLKLFAQSVSITALSFRYFFAYDYAKSSKTKLIEHHVVSTSHKISITVFQTLKQMEKTFRFVCQFCITKIIPCQY